MIIEILHFSLIERGVINLLFLGFEEEQLCLYSTTLHQKRISEHHVSFEEEAFSIRCSLGQFYKEEVVGFLQIFNCIFIGRLSVISFTSQKEGDIKRTQIDRVRGSLNSLSKLALLNEQL